MGSATYRVAQICAPFSMHCVFETIRNKMEQIFQKCSQSFWEKN